MNKAFTPLEVQKRFWVNVLIKAKPPFGSIPSNTKRSGKLLTGFTLVELLVVITIIIFLSAIILINYGGSQSQLNLQRSAHKLAQDIRRAQEMAMSAKECSVCTPIQVPRRYGLEFEEGRDYYILFADGNDNGRYEPAVEDKEVERIYFEKGISIQKLFTPDSKTRVWVAFKPPDPLTTIRDAGEDSSILEIQLINVNNQTKIVGVNKAGLIEVE